MTSESTNQSDEDYMSCMDRYDPRRDPIEFTNLLALIALGLGVVLICVGYLTPREFTFDPHRPAREMEAVSVAAERRAWELDVCIMMGMACVALGAFILSCILTYLLVTGEIIPICGQEEEDETEMLYPGDNKDRGRGYGTQQEAPTSQVSEHAQNVQETRR